MTKVTAPPTSHEQLLQICHNTFQNTPMSYHSKEITINVTLDRPLPLHYSTYHAALSQLALTRSIEDLNTRMLPLFSQVSRVIRHVIGCCYGAVVGCVTQHVLRYATVIVFFLLSRSLTYLPILTFWLLKWLLQMRRVSHRHIRRSQTGGILQRRRLLVM